MMHLLHRRRSTIAIVVAFALAGAISCSSDKNPSTTVADTTPNTATVAEPMLATEGDTSTAVADTTPETTTVAEPMLGTEGDSAVMVLTDDQVSAALDSAPPIMDIESLDFVGSRSVPTGFTVRVKLFGGAEGAYEFEVVDAATDQPLVVADLEVNADGIELAKGEANGQIRIDNAESSPGYYGAAIEVDGLDVGSARQISARVRLVASPGVERPWEDVLGCIKGATTFQWRNPDDDFVKIGACPNPFEWISTQPKVPSLAPSPELVATAAGFTEAVNLEQHFARLFATLRGDEGQYDPLHFKIEITMTIENGISEPLEILGPAPATDWDPAVVASSVEQVIEYTAQSPTGLEFDIQVISIDPKSTVLTVTGVQLPLAPTSKD